MRDIFSDFQTLWIFVSNPKSVNVTAHLKQDGDFITSA